MILLFQRWCTHTHKESEREIMTECVDLCVYFMCPHTHKHFCHFEQIIIAQDVNKSIDKYIISVQFTYILRWFNVIKMYLLLLQSTTLTHTTLNTTLSWTACGGIFVVAFTSQVNKQTSMTDAFQHQEHAGM